MRVKHAFKRILHSLRHLLKSGTCFHNSDFVTHSTTGWSALISLYETSQKTFHLPSSSDYFHMFSQKPNCLTKSTLALALLQFIIKV
jgi:hypothetical protein